MAALWSGKISFRAWVAIAMAASVLPIALAAGGGYVLLRHGVIDTFRDVVVREHDEVGAIQRLQLALHDIEEPVAIYVDEANPAEPGAYRTLRRRIELDFAALVETFKAEPAVLALVTRARHDWSTADDIGTAIIAVPRAAGDARSLERMETFAGRIAAAVDRLAAANDTLKGDLEKDYAGALLAYERSEWIAGIAAGVALLFIVGGVLIVSQLLLANVDRLVEGASRFAEGDRDHRIRIQVPRELRKVADEFNRMIERIHDAEVALEDLAQKDALTGLLNRRSFDAALQEASARAARFGETFALCLVDLDHFKQVNDTWGHAAGDQVLRVAAQLMKAELREIDKVFRFGGEEFAVLLPGVPVGGAMTTAERLRDRIEARPVSVDGRDIRFTVSIGVAEGSGDATDEALVQAADRALYRAKDEGRNRVRAA